MKRPMGSKAAKRVLAEAHSKDSCHKQKMKLFKEMSEASHLVAKGIYKTNQDAVISTQITQYIALGMPAEAKYLMDKQLKAVAKEYDTIPIVNVKNRNETPNSNLIGDDGDEEGGEDDDDEVSKTNSGHIITNNVKRMLDDDETNDS
jgi:uncharacterized caspase-like protein